LPPPSSSTNVWACESVLNDAASRDSLGPIRSRAASSRAAASAAWRSIVRSTETIGNACGKRRRAATPEAAETSAGAEAKEEEIHVEAEVDQSVFDQLIAEGKSERVARAKAKAAYVRAEKARIRAERAESVSS